jgi:serine/threonine-protein kinase
MDRPILIAELGSGGMADVFLAMRRGMGGFVKLVVIKRLREGAIEGDAVTMFHDEARISARLNHPNVIQTHEVGFDGDHYRLEMEYLDGQPLHRIVSRAKKTGRVITQAMAVGIVREVLAGLHYAHELSDYDGSPLGIVHRDVSPQNVFVTYDGRVKLVDFGIAKVAGQVAVTQIGMVKGKVRYMAPEQATGRPVDRRADIFAAGVVLWQLLVGRGYWADCEEIGIFHRLAMDSLPPGPRWANIDVPEELDRVCMRALAADPSLRYETAAEFAAALEPFAGARGGGAERSVGSLAAELFADQRVAIKREIEKAAARPLTDDEESPTSAVPMSTRTAVTQSGVTAPSDRPVSSHTQRPTEHRRSPWNIIALLVAAAAAAIAVLALVIAPRDARSVASPAAVVVPTIAPLPQPQLEDSRGAEGTKAPPPLAVQPEIKERKTVGKRAATEVIGDPGKALRAREGAAVPIVDAGAPPVPSSSARERKLIILDGDPWDAGSHP